MPVERSDFLLFMFKLFNNMYDSYITVSNYLIKLYDSIYNTATGLNSQWLFLSSYNIPIPLTHINNFNNQDIIWKYNQNSNSLDYNCNTTTNIKIPWLSAKIVSTHNFTSIKSEYPIDTFIESLKINTIPINAPSLYLIITLWSINNKIWFTREHNVQLCIIDDMGDEQIYSLNDNSISTSIERNKLIIKSIKDDYSVYSSESAENISDTTQIITTSNDDIILSDS